MKRGSCAKTLKTADDKLSQLPDELLICIVSLIPYKEAARTSVLSRRWKKVWTFSPVLNLDASNTCTYIHEQEYSEGLRELLILERSKYVNCVNSVLNSFQGSAIEELRVRFDLDVNNSHDVQRWVNFALEKNVQRLVIDLRNYQGFGDFRQCLLDGITTPLCNTAKMLQAHNVGIHVCSSLKVVRLNNVKVTEEVFEYLLSTCSSLEHLSLRSSHLPVNLKFHTPFLSLKYLGIIDCVDVKSIDICAPNLLAFRYHGRGHLMYISLEKIPNIAKLYVGCCYADYVLFENPSTFTNHFTQLETLSLDLNWIIKKKAELVKIPVLSRLKNLDMAVSNVDLCDGHSLLVFTPLIKSSPLLERFRLKLTVLTKFWMKLTIAEPYEQGSPKKRPECPHNNLKLMEIIGFRGCAIDNDFIVYLIENAVMLEKVVIDPRTPSPVDPLDIGFHRQNDETRIARVNAKQLERRFCLGDKLLVL